MSTSTLVIPSIGIVGLLLAAIEEVNYVKSSWYFVNRSVEKMTYGDMNEILMEILEAVNSEDGHSIYGLRLIHTMEDLSINRSTRLVSSNCAWNMKIPTTVIYIHNRWKKFDISNGRRPKLKMVEEYYDIDHIITSINHFSGML